MYLNSEIKFDVTGLMKYVLDLCEIYIFNTKVSATFPISFTLSTQNSKSHLFCLFTCSVTKQLSFDNYTLKTPNLND